MSGETRDRRKKRKHKNKNASAANTEDRLAHVDELEQRVAALVAGLAEEPDDAFASGRRKAIEPFLSGAHDGRTHSIKGSSAPMPPTILPSPFDLPGVTETWRTWGGEEAATAAAQKPLSLSSDDELYLAPKRADPSTGDAADAVHVVHHPAGTGGIGERVKAHPHAGVLARAGVPVMKEEVWDDEEYYDESYQGYGAYAAVPAGAAGYASTAARPAVRGGATTVVAQPGTPGGGVVPQQPPAPGTFVGQPVAAQPQPQRVAAGYYSAGGAVAYQSAAQPAVQYAQDPRRFVRR